MPKRLPWRTFMDLVRQTVKDYLRQTNGRPVHIGNAGSGINTLGAVQPSRTMGGRVPAHFHPQRWSVYASKETNLDPH